MNPHDLFEVPAPGPYLLSHSVGCLPRASRERINSDLLDPWGSQGSDGWGAWLAAIGAFRGAVVELIGGQVSEVCPQLSVSVALLPSTSRLPVTGSVPEAGSAARACSLRWRGSRGWLGVRRGAGSGQTALPTIDDGTPRW